MDCQILKDDYGKILNQGIDMHEGKYVYIKKRCKCTKVGPRKGKHVCANKNANKQRQVYAKIAALAV